VALLASDRAKLTSRASPIRNTETDAMVAVHIMLITIAATVAVVSVALVPALAEVRRVIEDRERPDRLLNVPTRRVRRFAQ
jgi:hypothetical protein